MSYFFSVFTVFGTVFLAAVFISCFLAGLMSLCEYVEKRPNFLKKLVKKFIFVHYYVIAGVHVGFLIFDRLSTWRLILSAFALALHYRLHLDLPKLLLIPSLVNSAVVLLNHFMWLGYFFYNDHTLLEVISFYFIMVWAAPISIAISYSTSELLPGFYEDTSPSYNNNRRHM